MGSFNAGNKVTIPNAYFSLVIRCGILLQKKGGNFFLVYIYKYFIVLKDNHITLVTRLM